MVVLAIVLSIVGSVGAIVALCLVVYAVYKPVKLEAPLPDGQYKIHFVGRNKMTNSPIYDVEEIEEKK